MSVSAVRKIEADLTKLESYIFESINIFPAWAGLGVQASEPDAYQSGSAWRGTRADTCHEAEVQPYVPLSCY